MSGGQARRNGVISHTCYDAFQKANGALRRVFADILGLINGLKNPEGQADLK